MLKSNPANVWGGGIDVFDGYSEYNAITEAGKAQVFEFQISDDLAADLAEGTLAYGIRLKYNAYHTDGDDLPNCNLIFIPLFLWEKMMCQSQQQHQQKNRHQHLVWQAEVLRLW